MPGQFAQGLDIGNQMPGRIGLKAGERGGAAAAALIEQNDAIGSGIVKAAKEGRDAATRSAMQDDDRLAPR